MRTNRYNTYESAETIAGIISLCLSILLISVLLWICKMAGPDFYVKAGIILVTTIIVLGPISIITLIFWSCLSNLGVIDWIYRKINKK